MKTKQEQKVFQGDRGSSEKAEVKIKVLREVLNCVGMWGGRLFQTRGVWTENKALEFPSCTGKSCFIRNGTESTRWSVQREAGWQVWWQGTIKETENKGDCLEEYPFFDWEPVKLFLRSGLICSCLLRKTTFAAWFWFFFRDGIFDQRWCQWAKSCNSPNDWGRRNTSAEQRLSLSGDGE